MEAKRTSERAKNLTTINAVAISIFAAFNPLLAHVANPVVDWALSIVSAGLFGLVACWLYLKLTRQQKPDSLAKGTALAAWFFMASTVLVPYLDKAQKQSPAPQAQTYEHRASEPTVRRTLTDEEVGFPAKPRILTDEEFGILPSSN